ncbi:uncharacterized protein LOC128677943 isoform X2 [Plodia interpunctella]|uniref:uncharacterized protein LOC128677943 isoform X2 n=1 Tax=Plodia interpunctella TaxID=58824 RepID=UPI0031014143
MRAAVILAILAVMAAIVVAEEDYAAYFKDDVKMKTAMECLLDKAPCGKLQGLRIRKAFGIRPVPGHVYCSAVRIMELLYCAGDWAAEAKTNATQKL